MEIELLAVFCTEIFYYILKKKKDTNNIDPIIKLPPEVISHEWSKQRE